MVLTHSVSFYFVPSPSLHLYLYTVPVLLPHISNFVNPCLFVPYSLPHFPVAYLMLNCIFAFPFFPWWKLAVLWVMHPPRGRGLEMAEGMVARATQKSDLNVAP